MPRKMRDPSFREAQWDDRYADHIAPINELLDELRVTDWAPYVAPMYGGVNARVLHVLRDPGPKTKDDGGSGFLCWENDDPTAETVCNLFAEAGIGANDTVPWNAFPWYINKNPTASQLQMGVEPLKQVIGLLPRLQVVMLLGNSAQAAWDRLAKKFPATVAGRGLTVIKTYHTSRQAFWHPDPAERDRRKAHLREAFREAARLLVETSLVEG